MKTCTLSFCDRKHYGRGYCNAHWQQVYRLKINPQPIRVRINGGRGCDFEGCDRRHMAHGLCPGHLDQRNAGRVLAPLRDLSRSSTCQVRQCEVATQPGGLCTRHAVMQRKYGVDAQEMQDLLDTTSVCMGCGGPFVGGPHPGAKIDHCHTTGRFRGLLCNNCNIALGLVVDDPERLRALATYIEERGHVIQAA